MRGVAEALSVKLIAVACGLIIPISSTRLTVLSLSGAVISTVTTNFPSLKSLSSFETGSYFAGAW
jgi:hypothetical protein